MQVLGNVDRQILFALGKLSEAPFSVERKAIGCDLWTVLELTYGYVKKGWRWVSTGFHEKS